MSTPEAPRARESALPYILVVVAMLVFIGVSVTLGLPFLRSRPSSAARSRANEVKTNLRMAFIAERAYFAEHDAYTPYVANTGFAPEVGSRYLYALSAEGELAWGSASAKQDVQTGVHSDRRYGLDDAALEEGVPDDVWDSVGVEGTCPSCDITVLAVSNLDGDPKLDVWTISTKDRVFGGVTVPGGEPFQHLDDSVE